jgi:predicted nucleic acid-binding protein
VNRLTVVYDACVLYPAPLRSFLMYLALTDVFHAKWTEEIHQEWMRNVLKDHPDITRKQVERIRELMNAHVRDCLVTGYESLIPSLALPDQNDRHVLAAAVHCKANRIITFNLRHFPAKALAEHGVQAQHPDAFISHLLDLAPEMVFRAAKGQRQSLKHPPLTADEYLNALGRQSLAATVAALRKHRELI